MTGSEGAYFAFADDMRWKTWTSCRLFASSAALWPGRPVLRNASTSRLQNENNGYTGYDKAQ
jgi:hypothetical protein